MIPTAPVNADTIYDQTRPWMTNEERLVGEALMSAANMPADAIRSIRPPIPRIALIPPRFGYRTGAIGIDDIFGGRIDNTYPGSRVDYSQTQSGIQSSSYPALGVM